METIIYIFLGIYIISLISGTIGSYIINTSIWFPRIGSYAILTAGHYVFHFISQSWYYQDKWHLWQNKYSKKVILRPKNNGHGGGKSLKMIPFIWWLKEVVIIFPLLGLYNLIILLYSLLSAAVFAVFISTDVFGVIPEIKSISFRTNRSNLNPRNQEMFDFNKWWII